MSAPRLVFVVTEDWYFISHRLPLAVAAKAAGYEVTVLTRCGEACHEIEAAGISIIPFSMARRGLNPLGVLREVNTLAGLYRRLRPDIAHHVALRPVVVGGLAARLTGVSNVVSAIAGLGYSFTDGRKGWLAWMLRQLLKLALVQGLVIVQNPDDRVAVTTLGVDGARIALIPGAGVDVQCFRPTRHEPVGPPVVLMAARLLWDKGVGEFVEVARQLQGRARFVLVGAPDPNNLACVPTEHTEAWARAGLIEFWGQQSDMAEVLRKADVFCLPSYREGMPKALLEAMATGLACVTTDAPGCRDALDNEVSGLIVPVKDARTLASAVARLLDDAGLRRRLGEAARARVTGEFSVERVIADTLAVYQNLGVRVS